MMSRRYEIKSLLARGGMAEVWLATLRGLHGFEKQVVLKTIRPQLAENADFIEMFKNEALLAAGLNHPNIVQILDLGQLDGQYYIAMEHVAGRTLRQIARCSREAGELLPPWFLLRAVIAACEALQHAHDCCDDEGRPLGLVHRDVSPENIMISFLGAVKILDFGVAKATAAADATVAGQLKGKFAYISPEQIHGRPVDRRSDIYALGVVLYELLTGRRPYAGSNELELLTKVIRGQAPPPATVAPWLSPQLSAIVMKALAVDPNGRYSEARALARDLQGALEGEQDRHGPKDLGLLVSSLFPAAPDIPRGAKRLIYSSGGGLRDTQLRDKLGTRGIPLPQAGAVEPAEGAPQPPPSGLADPVIEVRTIGSAGDTAPLELVVDDASAPALTRASQCAGKPAPSAPQPWPAGPAVSFEEIRRALAAAEEVPPKEDQKEAQPLSEAEAEPAADIWRRPSGASRLESHIFVAGSRSGSDKAREDRLARIWSRGWRAEEERAAGVWGPSREPEPIHTSELDDDDEVYDPITGTWVPRRQLPESGAGTPDSMAGIRTSTRLTAVPGIDHDCFSAGAHEPARWCSVDVFAAYRRPAHWPTDEGPRHHFATKKK